MGRVIFVDSGFFVALFDPKDDSCLPAHRLRSQLHSDDRAVLTTTRDVINEFLAHFSRQGPALRQRVARFARITIADPKYRVESVDDALYLAALDLYESRLDKRYSMVDCIGMTIMRRNGIDEVIATDRDFEQEGFINLMRRIR